MMANDPELKDQIVGMIQSEGVNAEYAAQSVANMTISMFESMDDAYFKERAADVKDVMFRLQCNLAGAEIPVPPGARGVPGLPLARSRV